MSIIRDPDTYERFEKVVLVHGVRKVDELAYADLIEKELPQPRAARRAGREKLIYYPTVTREPFRNQGRVTTSSATASSARPGPAAPRPENDRMMIAAARQC